MKGNHLILKDLSPKSRWCDKDHVLLCACFQLLVDFLEKEKPETKIDYRSDARHRQTWRELQALYRYWKKDRPKQVAQLQAMLKALPMPRLNIKTMEMGPFTPTKKTEQLHRRYHDTEENLVVTDDKMLKRIIEVRKHLWC